jgi:hypothetical protein
MNYESFPEYIEGPVVVVGTLGVVEWLREWLEPRVPRLTLIWRDPGRVTLYGVFMLRGVK